MGSCVYLDLKGDRKLPGDAGACGVFFIFTAFLGELKMASHAVSVYVAQRSQMALTCAK